MCSHILPNCEGVTRASDVDHVETRYNNEDELWGSVTIITINYLQPLIKVKYATENGFKILNMDLRV